MKKTNKSRKSQTLLLHAFKSHKEQQKTKEKVIERRNQRSKGKKDENVQKNEKKRDEKY